MVLDMFCYSTSMVQSRIAFHMLLRLGRLVA